VGKLKGESWEDCFEIDPILEISRAKEARPELSVRKADLGKRLGNGRLPGPRKAIEPEHTAVLFVLQPTFELQEDICPSSPQTPPPVPRTVSGLIGVMQVFQKTAIHIFLFTSYYKMWDQKGVRLTIG